MTLHSKLSVKNIPLLMEVERSEKHDDTTDGTDKTTSAANLAVRFGRQSLYAILAIQSLVSRESHCVYVLVSGLITGISTFARVGALLP